MHLFQLQVFNKLNNVHQIIALVKNKSILKSKRQILNTFILKCTYISLRISTLKNMTSGWTECFILLISGMMNNILEAAHTECSLKGEENYLMGFSKSHSSIAAWDVDEALSPFFNHTQLLLTLFKMSFWRHFKVPKHFRSLKLVTKLMCSAEVYEDKNPLQLCSRFSRSMFTMKLS